MRLKAAWNLWKTFFFFSLRRYFSTGNYKIMRIQMIFFYVLLVFLLILLAGRPLLGQEGGIFDRVDPKKEEKEPGTDEEFVPEWAKKVVWYQIFPERFRNGDPSNDPTVKELRGADPLEMPTEWKVHPWGSDWYELQDYEKENGEEELWKHLLRRRYGGDLQGIIDKLDYLKDLGITGIYLNPVFQSPSHHKYDGATYHHIDPNFGPDPEGDRALMATENPADPKTWVWTKADELALELIRECHKREIRIIFDGVFNHMGVKSFAFQDLLEKQQDSPYKNWFSVNSWDDPEKGTSFDYEGWWGVKSLPELKEDNNGIVKEPRDYIFAAVRRWMNPKGLGTDYGIDGWRLDVAYCVGHPFWKRFRKHVRRINPEAYLVAEITGPPEKLLPYVQGDEFDSEMNYNFAFAAVEFFINPKTSRISAKEFDEKLRTLREFYPKGVAEVAQNLLGSHDINRISSFIVNRELGVLGDWETWPGISKAAENSDYQVRQPTDEEYRLQKLLVLFQMTYVGAPMIYYGDEVGMWGANDPDCRKPMIWDDLDYDSERYLPDGSKRRSDRVRVNRDMLEYYRKLISIRNAHPALQLGRYLTVLADDRRDIYVFQREYDGEIVFVLFNNKEKEQTISIPIPKYRGLWKDTLNGGSYAPSGGYLSVPVEGKWGAILVR
jgi:cyclomaltodextrinase